MRRKIIFCILVVSLSFNKGCYSYQTIAGEEVRGTARQESKQRHRRTPSQYNQKTLLNTNFGMATTVSKVTR